MKHHANKFHLRIRALCEGAILVALAFVLSCVKLYQLPNGGSLTPAMFPILLFALRFGLGQRSGTGGRCGTNPRGNRTDFVSGQPHGGRRSGNDGA